jgi:hypothetical protein
VEVVMVDIVERDDGFKLVRTTQAVEAGGIVLPLDDGTFVDTPTRTSIRLGDGRHIEHPVGCCINHACSPSCEISGTDVVALVALEAGSEVTFDYTASEQLPLASPFTCAQCDKMLGAGPVKPCR